MVKRKMGFTLVELLVAVSILAVLTAILLPNFMGARDRAKDSQRIQDINSLKSALRMYYNDSQSYIVPGSVAWNSVADDFTLGCSNCLNFLATDSKYMPTMSGIGYSYAYSDAGDGFKLWVAVSSRAGTDNIDSQTKCGVTTTSSAYYMVCGN